jgi:hypothetical protein
MDSAKEDIAKLIKNRDEYIELMKMFRTSAEKCEENIKYILLTVLPNGCRVEQISFGISKCDKSPIGKCVYIITDSYEDRMCFL